MNGLEQDTALLKALADFTGLPPSVIATEAGLADTTISRPFRGIATTRLSAPTLEKLRARFPDFPGWLGSTFADPQIGFRHREPDPDLVQLAEFDVAYGLGGAFIHDQQVEARLRTFSRAWIRQFTPSPFEALYWATGNGTSMMPAILDNDILLIDTMQRTPRMWDQFWAIDMHGMGMIKALRPGKEGSMRILSINPDWPEEAAFDSEMNVVGRVVAIVRKV